MKRLLILVLACQAALCKAQPWPQIHFDSCSFTAVGHRGFPRIYPENTLMSLEEAFKRGVKYCEVDVAITKDDQYVLFHDEDAVYRTTNGTGLIIDMTYAQLKALDAGSWKGSQFQNVHVPTLVDAVRIAEKYDAHLYLDTKTYRADLMKKALDSTGARADRIVVPNATLAEAQAFRAVLPNTPWVWYDGGLYPAQISNDQFYTDCINIGCIAFEVAAFDDTDSLWSTFAAKVHAHGSKTWVFTDNLNERASYLRLKGADGLETDRSWQINQLLCSGVAGAYPDSLTSGNWRFRSSLKSTGIGSQVRMRNYLGSPTSMQPTFNTCSQFGIPLLQGIDAEVMKVPAQDSANGLFVYTNFVPEDFGVLEGSFSVLMDFLMPNSAFGKWVALYQTSVINGDDADLFINTSGAIGTVGNYHGTVSYNSWHRLVFTIDRNNLLLKKYLDGNYLGATSIWGSRWMTFNASPRGETQGFVWLGDNDNETSLMYVSALQLRDYVLDSVSVKKLGGPAEPGIPMANADLYNVKITGAISDSSILDYDREAWYVLVPASFNLATCSLSFDLSAGAKASIASNTVQNISSGTYSFNVTSEDSLRTKTWTIHVVKQQNVGLNEINESLKRVEVYPNPSNGNVYLRNAGNLTHYTVFDPAGRALLSGQPSSHIDLSALEPGIYFITLKQLDGTRITTRIVRE